MNIKKVLLIFGITITAIIAIEIIVYAVFGRLYIIRLTIGTKLPDWIKLLLWGWW